MTVTLVIVVVVLLLAAAFRLWLTANRLDRLHLRTEAAWAALEQALARRIVATRALATAGRLPADHARQLRELADAADSASRGERERVEERLTAALEALPGDERAALAAELADAGERIVLARQFYNDAVRDTRGLRASWFTRLFRLAGHARLPDYFGVPEAGVSEIGGSGPDEGPALDPATQ